jgi:hypothetical protein
LYKRNNFSEAAEKPAVVLPPDSAKAKPPTAVDTTSKAVVKDTVVTAPTAAAPAPTATIPAATAAELSPPPGAILYRFVILATDNKHHALRRYNQLLGYQLNIKMYQKDSAWFKLYFPIAARPRDTTNIKDSLADTYAVPNVIIEH